MIPGPAHPGSSLQSPPDLPYPLWSGLRANSCAQARSIGPESGPQDEPGRIEGAVEALGLDGIIVIVRF